MGARWTAVRSGLVVAAAGAAATGGLRLAGPTVTALLDRLRAGQRWTDVPFDVLVTTGAAALVAGAAVWLAAVTAATVLSAVTGVGSTAVRALSPAAVRRLVALACGLAVAGSAWPATAAAPTDRGVVDGLPLPDRATDALLVADPVRERPQTHTVRSGDSLWSLAVDLLGPTAPAVRVEATWRAVYDANRRVVGPDPDLLRPGTVLRLPPSAGSDRKDSR